MGYNTTTPSDVYHTEMSLFSHDMPQSKAPTSLEQPTPEEAQYASEERKVTLSYTLSMVEKYVLDDYL